MQKNLGEMLGKEQIMMIEKEELSVNWKNPSTINPISLSLFGSFSPLKSLILLIFIALLSGCGNQFDKEKDPTRKNISEFLSPSGEIQQFEQNRSDIIIGPVDVLEVPPQYVLLTQGRNVQILAKEIYASDMTIRTFEENSTAELGRAGLSGGTVTINAQKLVGQLTVEMRGQNGGKGLEKGTDRNYDDPQGFYKSYIFYFCNSFTQPNEVPPQTTVYDWANNPLNGSLGGAGGDSGLFNNRIAQVDGKITLKSTPGEGGLRGEPGKLSFRGVEVPFAKNYEIQWPSGSYTGWHDMNCPIPINQPDSKIQALRGQDLNQKNLDK